MEIRNRKYLYLKDPIDWFNYKNGIILSTYYREEY